MSALTAYLLAAPFVLGAFLLTVRALSIRYGREIGAAGALAIAALLTRR